MMEGDAPSVEGTDTGLDNHRWQETRLATPERAVSPSFRSPPPSRGLRLPRLAESSFHIELPLPRAVSLPRDVLPHVGETPPKRLAITRSSPSLLRSVPQRREDFSATVSDKVVVPKRDSLLRGLKACGASDGCLGGRAHRLSQSIQVRQRLEAVQRARSDGDIAALRMACRQAAAAFGRGRSEPRELRTAWALLEAAERCSRDCRAHFGLDRGVEGDSARLRIAVQAAQRLELGPRLWEEPWLAQAREFLRAERRRFQWDQAAEVGEERSLQEERREELKKWLYDRRVPLECGAGHFGPTALLGSCAECGTSHAWFCHGCGLVQFAGEPGTPCLQGCNRAKFGWTCLGWTCNGSRCDCRHGDTYWRIHGSVRLHRSRTPSPEKPDCDYSHLESKTMEQLEDYCKELGEYRWMKSDPATDKAIKYLRRKCSEYEVSDEGTYKVLIQRLFWARDVRWKYGKNQTQEGVRRKAMVLTEVNVAQAKVAAAEQAAAVSWFGATESQQQEVEAAKTALTQTGGV